MSNFRVFHITPARILEQANNESKNGFYECLNFKDIPVPLHGSDGTGKLYKKNNSGGLFWLPDSAGNEVNLTTNIGLSVSGGIMSGNIDMSGNLILNVGTSSGIGQLVATNTTNNTGSVTVHSDVTNSGSGIIMSSAERTKLASLSNAVGLPLSGGIMSGSIDMSGNTIINVGTGSGIGQLVATNTTNNTGSVTVHSDVTNSGSGIIMSSAERTKLASLSNAVGLPLSGGIMSGSIDMSGNTIINVGTGSGIGQLVATNTTNNTGSVTVHSDVTNSGSGIIMSSAERTKLASLSNAVGLPLSGGIMSGSIDMSGNTIINVGTGSGIGQLVATNTTNNTGSVTVHSDVTNSGSGIIMSSAERTKLASLTGSDSYVLTNVSGATYTALTTDGILLVDRTSSGICTITLPQISALTDNKKRLTIIDSGGNAVLNNITINRGGSDTINNETSILINNNYNSLTLISDAASMWLVI